MINGSLMAEFLYLLFCKTAERLLTLKAIQNMTNNLPILYSFRRCPYAIRARLAIAYAGIPVEIREVAF
jgi:hypothetical protein